MRINKVSFFNKKVLSEYFIWLGKFSVLVSFIIILFKDITEETWALITLVTILVMTYLFKWWKANNIKQASLYINKTKVTIKEGNIFEEEGLKVISFNEYFDTVVDDKIIAHKSLNGIFIDSYLEDSISKLDELILENAVLKKYECDYNGSRGSGKKIKYKLGSIHKYKDYLLLAFSKFDDNNRAYLSIVDFTCCLLNFWDQVDINYNQNNVIIPLMGSGITRFTNGVVLTEQELLELLLWSYKVSKKKLSSPAEIIILIHESKIDSINLYKLKGGDSFEV